MSVTPPFVLPGNILSLTDSDFESGTPTWGADTNASAPAVSATYSSFSGSLSLAWTAVTSADTIIASGYYPCTGNRGYDISGHVVTPANQHDCYIGVRWYTSAHALITSAWGLDSPSTQDVWQPFVAAVTSPSNAAYFKVACWASTFVVASEPFAIDLMYAAQVPAQVLIDWTNPSFLPGSIAGTDFEDATPWVRWDTGVSLSRGRQDSVSEIQTGQTTIPLENDNGWFTPQNLGSPYPGVSLGCRVQVNETDQLGAWSTRFDGAISEITYAVDTLGETNIATVNASDVLAPLNRQDELQCWTNQTVLTDTPWLHWALNDNGNTGVAAETSGNNGPVLRVFNPGSLAWQNSNGGVETQADAVSPGAGAAGDGSAYWTPGQVTPLTAVRGLSSTAAGPYTSPLPSVYFTPTLVAQTAQNLFIGNLGASLQAELYMGGFPVPINTITGNYTLECWFTQDPGIKANLNKNYGPFIVMSLASSRQSSCMMAGVINNGTGIYFGMMTFAQPPSFAMNAWGAAPTVLFQADTAMTVDSVPLPHHLVMTIAGASGGGIITLFLDNVDVGSITLPAGQLYDTATLGGAYGGGGNWWGNISCASIYQYILSPAQIANHCQVGQYGMWETTTDNCVAALGNIAGMPGFWVNLVPQNNGLTLAGYLDITGSNALEGMQLYEQAERGLLFVNSLGQLTFHTRDWRLGYPGPDLTLPADVYTADLGYELIDTFLLNEAATATVVFTTGVDWVAEASQNSYGVYANGTQESPIQLPLITWSRAYSALGLQQLAFWSDPNLNDNSSWQVYTRNQPRLTCGQLTVDMQTLNITSGLTATELLALDIDNVISLSGLPASFPNVAQANDFFIEGVNETISLSAHTLSFYLSPASIQRAWRPGDAVYGQLGTTSRIGISQPDLSVPPALGKTVSHDAGGPYWPPQFTTQPYTYQLGYVNTTSATPVLTPGNYGQGYSAQGDCLLAEVMAPAAATITVTDSQGNTYTQISSVTLSTGHVQYLFAAFNCFPVNLNDTVTFTTTASQAYVIALFGLYGVIAVDGTPVTATATSTGPNVTIGTLSASNDFELVVIFNDSTATAMVPSGWTQMGRNNSAAFVDQMFWKQATTTSGDTLTATLPSSVPWGAIGIPFTLAAFTMNNPANNNHSFVGATDIRGIRDTLATALCPPLMVAGSVSHNQTIPTGNAGISHLTWDTVYIDTVSGMGSIGGWPNWYTVSVPGYYEICASLVWDQKSSGAAGCRNAWIIIAGQAAQALAAGTGNPLTVNNYIVPTGEQVSPNNFSVNPVCCPSVRVYLGVGDMVTLGVMQSQGSNDGTGTSMHGSLMSLRWLGYSTLADRIPVSAQPPGGAVTPAGAGAKKKTYTKKYFSQHTLGYYGTSSSYSPQLRSTDGTIGQGMFPGSKGGSQFSFALMPYTQMASDLSGAVINSVKLHMFNEYSAYGTTGATLMVGWSTASSFGSTFAPGGGTHFDLRRIYFKYQQTLTADLGIDIATAFQSGGARSLAFGNNSTSDQRYYGYWGGGSDVELIVTYSK